ncbi:MAG: D-glycero-beta-D-manno-heptose 1-phosphate adenylyltransferase [Candidatus Omnitrophota bacterium]
MKLRGLKPAVSRSGILSGHCSSVPSRARVSGRECIKSLSSLKNELYRLKSRGKKVVFTNGCFDILHYGHVKYLQDARAKGDCLVVAVNSDASIRRIKGKNRPVVGENDRLKVVSSLGCVDFAVLFNEDNPLKVIKALKPDVLIKGADWSKDRIIGADFVKSYGGKVLTVKLVKGRSTTALIEKIVRDFGCSLNHG